MGCVLFSVIFVNGLFPFLDQKKPEVLTVPHLPKICSSMEEEEAGCVTWGINFIALISAQVRTKIQSFRNYF